MLFALGLTFCIGVTEACITDPTESTDLGWGTETVTCVSVNDQITDAVTQVCPDASATDTSVETGSETVTETVTDTATATE